MGLGRMAGVTVLLLCHLFAPVSATTWAAATNNYDLLYRWYYNSGTSLTDLIPKTDLSQAITVGIAMSLDSINGFDAVKGQLDISGSVKLEWMDQTNALMQASGDATYTSGLTTTSEELILMDHDKAWSPSLVLLNAVDSVRRIGVSSATDTTYKLQYNITDGTTKWQPRVMLRASCTPDVTRYPFDRQKCSFVYAVWGYATGEIVLSITNSLWDQSQYSESGVWKIESTKSTTYESGGSSYAKFEIEIEREPLYFTFNIVLPILLLGLLNGFVFLLPAESGERVGFCITCFLSFVVFLQTTMSFLPQIASPMSLLCYYIIMMMIFSVFINILTILMLRIYHKPADSEVPQVMQKIVRVIRLMVYCGCCREGPPEKIDWPTIGRLLDLFFFVAFLAIQSAFSVLFIIPIAVQ